MITFKGLLHFLNKKYTYLFVRSFFLKPERQEYT